MAEWIRPLEMTNAPVVGDQDLHHGFKLLEENDLATLEATVMAYLLTLETSDYPVFLQDIRYTYYSTATNPKDHHIATVLFGAFGDLP